MLNLLKPGERLDDLEYGGLKLIQDPSKYCFTSDAVILANLTRANSGDTVVDLGTGSGVVAILVAAKTRASKIVGVELQADMAELALRNCLLNELQDKIEILNCDIMETSTRIGKESAEVVVCNPPYFAQSSGETRANDIVALSRHESTCNLAQIVDSASKLLKFGGKLFMVHKCERLAEVICAMKDSKIEPKQITLIYPKQSKIPDTFVVEGKKCAQAGLKISSIVIYNEDGSMTDEAKKLYNK